LKKILGLISLIIFASSGRAEEFGIGEEYIEPLKYPKFFLTADYAFGRSFHGFDDKALRYELDKSKNVAIGFEAGLLKYLNAGAMLSFNIPEFRRLEPVHYRFAFFAKPFYQFTNNFGVFARFGAGISSTLGLIKYHLIYNHHERAAVLERVYKNQNYSEFGPGALGMATVGLEYFPLSRFGISLEAGFRAEAFYLEKGGLIEALGDEIGPGKINRAGMGPNSFTYMIYEWPVALTLHIIL
jgi:hypothetical protein